ncbi:MAG: zinc ribbon domain-containing protein [Candidatus Auribacterota bacterium]|nr:zinc ribbon domain-containing protein [Candidatus Auribacterota bacterium]
MPTYEYECKECSHTFEAFQKMSDAPLTTCPECKGEVRRLIGTGAGIIFKGSGFYCTDYKRKEEKPKKAEKSACESCPNASSGCSNND